VPLASVLIGDCRIQRGDCSILLLIGQLTEVSRHELGRLFPVQRVEQACVFLDDHGSVLFLSLIRVGCCVVSKLRLSALSISLQ